jgi:hypothetical protein
MSVLLDRFAESLVMNHERWHDGTGYALELLDEANAEERAAIESLILSRAVRDWRDVEALAVLDSPAARRRLQEVNESGDEELRLALVTHAADQLGEEEACGILLTVLKEKGIHDGLTGALLVIEEFHPAPVMDALLEAARDREGPVAAECAAMLLYLHGLASSPHGFEDRPLLLRFHEEAERASAFSELCGRIPRPTGSP